MTYDEMHDIIGPPHVSVAMPDLSFPEFVRGISGLWLPPHIVSAQFFDALGGAQNWDAHDPVRWSGQGNPMEAISGVTRWLDAEMEKYRAHTRAQPEPPVA